MRAPFPNASRPRRAAAVATAIALACLATAPLLAPGAAEARLSVLPGRPGGPRPSPTQPSPTPQAVGSSTACQDAIRRASAELATSVRAAFAECLRTSLPCIFDAAGAASCCAAAAPGCVSRAEDVAAAGAAFVADVVGPACSTVPFAELAGEDGLDFGARAEACLRLAPPVSVDGLGSLATCLERLVTEDVLHLVSTTEQPRALEALVCMDLEDRFPGVLRERPATCEDLPVATPSPAPTPVPTPSPQGSPAGSPTPGGSPGAPTPTPGGTTPTPTPQPTSGATCTQVDVTVTVDYSAVDHPDVSGITVGLGYPQSVSIPGIGSDSTVLERVSNLTGVQGLFNVGDVDAERLLNVGVVSLTSPVPSADFARVRFDCASGAAVPAPAAFACTVDAATFTGGTLAPDQTQCVVTVAAP